MTVINAVRAGLLLVQISCLVIGTVKGFREGRRNGDYIAGMPWLIACIACGPVMIVLGVLFP